MSSNKNKTEEKNLGRVVFLSGRLDENKAKEVIENLIKLQNENPADDITLLIDSYGGYVDSMFAITDIMEIITCDIRTVCVGKAMSAAAFIFVCGSKGKRFMTRKSRLMFHQISGFSYGVTKDAEIDVKEQKRLQAVMVKEISNGSKLSVKEVEKLIDRDTYVIFSEAVKMGVCDGVVNNL